MSGVSIRPFRLTAWWAKLGLFVAYLVAGRAGFFLLESVGAPIVVPLIFGLVVSSLFFVLAVRVSRGVHEPRIPRRPWWRATARPTAGFVIGGLAVLFAGSELRQYLFVEPPGDPLEFVVIMFGILQVLLIAAYLINSSVRLRALPAEPKPPKSGLVRPSRSLRSGKARA